jgi:CYTH domain-containing protein/GNAT superfamily N-acetyltransferase
VHAGVVTSSKFSLQVRGPVVDEELTILHAAASGSATRSPVDWRGRLAAHSITWVTVRDPDGDLVGFVNVVGDGGEHAFLLDTVVRPDRQRTGIGRELVAAAEVAARRLGCRWLHVDYEPRHARFYEEGCGFRPTLAGLKDLHKMSDAPGGPAVAGANLKYARIEWERRWLLAEVPDLVSATRTIEIVDRYVRGARLRLREVTGADGSVVRKLGHKIRLGDDAREVACTSMYLDDAEWDLLAALPADVLHKTRSLLEVDGGTVAVDAFAGDLAGLVLAEIDAGDGRAIELPTSYGAAREVSDDQAFMGASLARHGRP